MKVNKNTVEFTFLNELRLLKEIMLYFDEEENEEYQEVCENICNIYHECKYNENMPTLNFDYGEFNIVQESLIDAYNSGIWYQFDRSKNKYFFKSLCDLFDVADIIETLDSEIEAVDDASDSDDE